MGMKGGGGGGKQESGNKNLGLVTDLYKDPAKATGQATDAISALLGFGGDPAAQKASLDQFSDSTGMNFMMDQGTRAITGNKAAAGLLQSGSTGKALTEFGQGLGKTYLNQFMDNLFKYGQLGLGSGGLLVNAGQYSKGKQEGQGKGGLGGLLGAGLSLI